MSKLKLKKWDVAEHLQTDEDIALFLEACIDEDPGDGSVIRSALGSITRARDMNQIAQDAGLTSEGLHRALSNEGNSDLGSILKVIRALGIKLHAEAVA